MNVKIDMDFIKKEIKNQVADKLDNMCCSEISEELYEFLQDKTDIICESVYEVLSNNELVINNGEIHLKAQDGFDDRLVLDWDLIEECEGDKRKEVQSTILYNYDALWMTAIHKAFPEITTDTRCGCGEMKLVKKATLNNDLGVNSLILQFAILWGEKIASPLSSKEREIAEEMKQYETDELLSIFSAWAEKYDTSAESDTVDFFEEQLTDLMHE